MAVGSQALGSWTYVSSSSWFPVLSGSPPRASTFKPCCCKASRASGSTPAQGKPYILQTDVALSTLVFGKREAVLEEIITQGRKKG